MPKGGPHPALDLGSVIIMAHDPGAVVQVMELSSEDLIQGKP